MSYKTVAIIPTEKWHRFMFRGGRLGARGPSITNEKVGVAKGSMIVRQPADWHETPRYDFALLPDVEALPLVWERKPVPEGIALALRALGAWGVMPKDWAWMIAAEEADEDFLKCLDELVRLLTSAGIAKEVVKEGYDAEPG